MANGALTVLNQNVHRQVRRKNQSVRVKSKQISVENNVDKLDQKVFKDEKKLSKAAEKIEVAEKENTPILRRSKRKAVAPMAVKLKADLPVASKTKRLNAKASQNVKTGSKTPLEFTKDNSVTVTKDTNDKIQNCSNLSPVVSKQEVFKSGNSNNLLVSSPLNRSDDSGFESSTRVSDQSLGQTQPVLLNQSTKDLAVDNEACILTSDSGPLNYWMELAEQTRKSLETALQENESLHDQLAVLEAENSQLKQLIKDAEEFAEIIKGIVK